MSNRHRAAAVIAAVVAAHAVLVGVLLGSPQRASVGPAAPLAGQASAARITWLSLPVASPVKAATLSAAPPTALPRAAAAERATVVPVRAPLLALSLDVAPVDAELLPLAELRRDPLAPVRERTAPAPVAGVALPSHFSLFGGSGGFGNGRASPVRPALARAATAGAAPLDPAMLVWRAELVAALMQQFPGHPVTATAGIQGYCVAEDSTRLRCDHAQAHAALGDVAERAIALLLHRLAALSPEPASPAVAYAEGRFRIDWR